MNKKSLRTVYFQSKRTFQNFAAELKIAMGNLNWDSGNTVSREEYKTGNTSEREPKPQRAEPARVGSARFVNAK